MDGFAFVVLACGVAVLLVLLALGKYYPGSGAEQLDWKPTRSLETEIQLELDDVDQMIEAQNERRRRTGRPERNEDDVRAEVDTAQRELEERRAAYLRDRGDA
jgi:hypothetical protein